MRKAARVPLQAALDVVVAAVRGVLRDAHAPAHDPQEDTYVNTLEATTQYSGYLRFGVSTEESFGGPKTP